MRFLGRTSRTLFCSFVLIFVLLNLWVFHRLSVYEIEHDGSSLQRSSFRQHNPKAESNNKNPKISFSVGQIPEQVVVHHARSKRISSPVQQYQQQPKLVKPQSSFYKKENVCEGYKGVLHIKMGDIGGAAGTIFFQFVLAQLIYAEQYHLIPWIYFDTVSNVIYDEAIHGAGPGIDVTFKGVGRAVDVVRPKGHWRDRVPGAIQYFNTSLYETRHFAGDGVWDHYFLPVFPSFVPGDPSCKELPYVTLTLKQITPGLHGFVSWAPKCWRYHYLPDYITKPHIPIREWLRPFRLLGNKAVERYRLRFQPHIVEAATKANPHCAPSNPDRDGKCLGLHIRHSDKAAGRRQVPVLEFLPYVRAFYHAGGEHIYLATDSTQVLKEIAETWPSEIRIRIRSLGDDASSDPVIRSDNEQAVFDMASHHRTNTEVLIEILSLSWCRFMVNGLSAVSESSLWLHGEALQTASIDLEDPERLNPAMFGTLVQMVIRDNVQDPLLLPRPPPSTTWWKVRPDNSNNSALSSETDSAMCSGFNGILLISSSGGNQISIGTAFFVNVLNQIIYAEKHNWLPLVHFQYFDKKQSVLYDRWAHDQSTTKLILFKPGYSVELKNQNYPDGPPKEKSASDSPASETLIGSGIWSSYMEPAHKFNPRHGSCMGLPLVQLKDHEVMSITNNAPWAVRAWLYDPVPEHLSKSPGVPWKDWYAPMRERAHALVNKHYHFHPYLKERADEVLPVPQRHEVCLSVHMRNGEKKGKSRKRISAEMYLPYFQEFAKAGGSFIYIATDSQRVLQFINKNFPENITKLIRTQGDQVVRTTKEWPLDMIDNHHRVNSEALVDILAMSKCHFLLHTFSTMAEAAIYVNLELHENSINLEDPDRLSPAEFGTVIKRQVDEANQYREVSNPTSKPLSGPIIEHRLENASVMFREVGRDHRRHALVYLAQKKHSSYTGKDSYSSLLKSLDLVNKNYLSLNNHLENLDMFIFHTNDFTEQDLEIFETRLGPLFRGVIRLVNLAGSPFWQRPPHHANDDPSSWYAYPLFSEGYRRMMHWFAIDIWDFFSKWNDKSGSSYRYIFRLDEDSFLHSPIRYDIFEFMQSNQYVYGYRLCTYEMQVTKRMWTLYDKRTPDFHPKREVDLEMCAFYNNFFVADLEFFRSTPVQKFLRFIDRQGQIYRRRLGDLMIHSMTAYAFAEPTQIHRFLDFTYEHGTINQTNGCLVWGGIQAGYDDDQATATISEFYQQKLLDTGCKANATLMYPQDLSPTYAHVPAKHQASLALYTVTAGRVEFPLGKGLLSG